MDSEKQPELEEKDKGQLELDKEDNGQLKLNKENDGQLEMNKENDGQLEMKTENDGQLKLNKENDGHLEMNKENDGLLEMNKENDGQLELNKESDGQLELNKENDGQLELNKENDGQLELNKEDTAYNDEWKNQGRHIFILSSAGKPVYSRYGCEDKLVTLFGVMQALVSFVQDSDDVIQAIYFGNKVLVFLIKGPIILVSVSNTRESVKFLNNQLMYVYNQVVSVLTLTRVTRIFEQRHNYDLRRLLTGTERLLDSLLVFTESRPEFLLDGVECLPLQPSMRETISNAIVSTCNKIKNLVFAILIANDKLITFVHLKKYLLKPSDLHLIFNMVSTYESLRTAECNWTPICLPNFDSSGYLHGHITYLCDESDACLILLTVDAELFNELSAAKKKITEKLIKSNAITAINNSLKTNSLDVAVPSIKHFLYKCKRSTNIIAPEMKAPYQTVEYQRQLLHQYQIIHSIMHEGSSSSNTLKLVHQQFNTETIIGWITDRYELYVTIDSLQSKGAASEAIEKLLKWLQKEEEKLFLMNVPTF